MDKDTDSFAGLLKCSELTPETEDGEPEIPELYKKAYLENDAGAADGFCQNTTTHD